MDRRAFLLQSASCTFLAASSGCGTLMYSERIGQPHSRDIDWKIVALDGLGLVLFFVPGVIAFAVDFTTGAIYLPYETYGAGPGIPPGPQPVPAQLSQAKPQGSPVTRIVLPSESRQQRPDQAVRADFQRIEVAREDFDPRSIELAVARHVGRQVNLNDPGVRMSRLSNLDKFQVVCQQHRSDPSFGLSSAQFLQRRPA